MTLKKKVGGQIAYFNLENLWFEILTPEERNIVRNTFRPMLSTHLIDEGNIRSSSQSKVAFLGILASWFAKKETYPIGIKILREGELFINNKTDVLDRHFFYLSGIKLYYGIRNNQNDALDNAIRFCKAQIEISTDAKRALLKEYPTHALPIHLGYKQLAIIFEKQKKYDEALALTKQALAEGWNIEDCKNRIEKLEKILMKKVKS